MAAIAFITSYIRYIVVTSAGNSHRSVEICFPDDEDYDAIELIDRSTLKLLNMACMMLAYAEKVNTDPEHWMLDDQEYARGVELRIPTI